MPDFQARCVVLEAENQALRDRVVWLEQKVGLDFQIPLELRLTPHEAHCLGVLKQAAGAVTKEAMLSLVYQDRITDGEVPEIKIIDVFVYKLRKKLTPWGIEIKTLWGRGYEMPRASKDKLRAMIGEMAA